jgi:Na+/H+ antiporter NhaD/arsenite permease-like protein
MLKFLVNSGLGGNGTANVIVVGMSEKMCRRITFGGFMLYGMP